MFYLEPNHRLGNILVLLEKKPPLQLPHKQHLMPGTKYVCITSRQPSIESFSALATLCICTCDASSKVSCEILAESCFDNVQILQISGILSFKNK